MAENGEDDWFSEPDVRPLPGGARQPVEDESLEGDDRRPRPAPAFDLRALADRRVLVVASVFVAFLLAVLAAAGVFSSGAPRTTVPIITTTAPPATPTTTARPAVGPPATALKPGDTGAQVKVLQRALASLGYAAGAVDGQYGPATKQAVAAFQHAHGLTGDGIFGPKTLQALTRALGR
jgi:Putative peptidoglycan binding domain